MPGWRLKQLAGCHPTYTIMSSVPMGSSAFPHGLSQEGQCGHICVWQGVADKRQLQDPAWPEVQPSPYQLQISAKWQTVPEPDRGQLLRRREEKSDQVSWHPGSPDLVSGTVQPEVVEERLGPSREEYLFLLLFQTIIINTS